MCEPTHSIIQYNDPNSPDDNDDNISAQGGYVANQLTSNLNKWAKKIKKWLHLSMMGRGHSETIGARSGLTMRYYDTTFQLYEAMWWNRTVKDDSYSQNASHLQLNCAEEYANLVSIGDMTQLRRFLETSMRNSDRPEKYAIRVRESLLLPEGKRELDKKFKAVFKDKISETCIRKMCNNGEDFLDQIIKFVLGWTRKRNFLVPEWADDTKIWLPK